MELRGRGENSSGGRGPEEIEQKVSQHERRKVINGEGFLKTIRRHFSFCEHSRRIVDQDIDPRETSVKPVSQTMDLCLRRQVCEEQDGRVARSTLARFPYA